MARTKDQSFVNAYLNQYQQNQKNAVSSGQQAASNAASSGVRQMNATGSITLPSVYDPMDDLYDFVLDQQEAQLKAQQAAAKAAQQAQEKAQKEAQERAKEAASESSAASTASNPLANRLSQTRAQSKVAEEEQPKKGLFRTIGDWVSDGLSALTSRESAENASGQAGVPARSLAKTAAVERPASAYDAMTTSEKLTAAQNLSAQAQALQKQIDALERQKIEPKTGAGAYDEEAYAIVQKNRQIVEQQEALEAQRKRVNDQISEVSDALWNDPEYAASIQTEIDAKPESQRIEQYLDPTYKLNKLEEEDAKKIADRLIKEAYDVPRGATQGQLSDAFDKEILGKRLIDKTSNAAAVSAGVASAIPFAEEADRALTNWMLGEDADKYSSELPSLGNFIKGAKTQSPIAYTAGNVGGNLALYSVGSSAARSIPALQRVGQAAAATPAAQALQKVPVLGRLGTADAITGIYGDTLVDLALDTVPNLGNDIAAYNRQRELIDQGRAEGKTLDDMIPMLEEYQGEYLTPGGIAADALKGIGTNLAFNLGGELVPELLKVGGQKLRNEFASVPSLDDGAQTAARVVGNTDVPSLDDTAQAVRGGVDDVVSAWRSGTLTNAQLETLKPGGVNRAAFEQATGMKLPDTSSGTRQFLRQSADVPSLEPDMPAGTVAADNAPPSLYDGLPESIGAKRAAFGYAEVPSQANTVQSIDEQFLRPEDIAAQGGQRQYTHQRISMAQQADTARQIRQTEADDEIIQRIANKENGGGNVSWEDVSTLGAITRDMDRKLSMLDPKSQEYSDLMAKKLYASDVLQSGVSETGRALQSTQQFTLPERGIMQVQRTITDTADAMEKSHGKAFKQGREAVKEAVEKSTQQAEKAANDVFANSLAGRVSATVNQTPAQIDPEAKVFKDMVNELYRVAKESPLPNRVAGANIPATDKIRAAFENRSGYEEVWDKAKEIVSKRFANDKNALSQLDAYLKNIGDGGLYSANTVRSAVKESASSLGIDFRKLAKQYSTNKDAALRSLTNDIISKTGVSGRDAAELADRIMVAYNQEMNRAIESNLKAALPELFEKTRATQKRAAIDRFVQLLNMGVYNDDTVKQLVASKWGVAPLSVEQATSITTILKEADKLPQGSKARYDLEMQAAAIAAESINTSLLDKWNAWRYMAMLGNVRTNEKNISSNVAQGGLARTKEFVQAMIESGVDAVSRAVRGKGIQRTTAIVNPFSAEGKKLLSAALSDADNTAYKDLIGTSEYFDITKQMGHKVFDTKWLENVRKGISGALEGADYYGAPGALDFFKKAFSEDSVAWKAADMIQRKVGMYGEKTAIGISGLRNNYAWSLAEYLKANRLDPSVLNAVDDASVQVAAQARAWAIKQALENTYHEESAVASALSNFSKMLMQSDSKGAKALGVVLEGNFPFKKTPINVLKEALRYSPAGIVEPAIQAVISVVKKGNAPSAAEWADSIAKALTGTGLIALGAYMRSIGVLNSSFDDVAAAGKEGTGEQEYSLRFEDEDGNLVSYTIDWLSPIALPLFMGAEYYDRAIKGGEGILSAIANGVAALADPVTEMTFLSSLNNTLDTFNTVKQSSEPSFALPAAAISAGSSYFTQGVPTMLGQVARSVDDTRRSTYTGKTGVPNVVGRQIESVQNKLPGLSMLNEPYIDQWGNTDENEGGSLLGRLAYNTLSPGFVSIAPADDTMQMLESLDDKSVWPGYAPYSVEYTVDGEKQKKRWTPEEYTQYATARGQGSREIADAFTYDAAFALLPPEQQASLLDEAYTYADFAAKRELIPSLEEQFQQDLLDNPSKTDRLNAIYDEYGAEVLVPVLVADEITSGIGADKNAKGNSIPGSREKNFIETLMQNGYTRGDAEALYQLLK
ncbi:hypothetical protein [Candidatus Allofournierella merdipullorum]|uniref:hypothetical protein n=1 Tax=Candidatus Allofournierella merdipullorum TaxID=2838595 RepID=UPI00374EBDA2